MKQVGLLSGTTRILHVIVAVAMMLLIAVGIYMTETESYGLYGVHKSVGAITFIFAIARVVWRIKEGWPIALNMGSKIQLLIAKVIHWILIVATVLFPMSGLMLSVGGGYGLFVFGVELIAENLDPISGEVVAISETISALGSNIHEILPPLVIFAIVLHIVGAMKHHIIDKDETIKRMFTFK